MLAPKLIRSTFGTRPYLFSQALHIGLLSYAPGTPDSYYGNRLLKRTQPRLFPGREVGKRSLEGFAGALLSAGGSEGEVRSRSNDGAQLRNFGIGCPLPLLRTLRTAPPGPTP